MDRQDPYRQDRGADFPQSVVHAPALCAWTHNPVSLLIRPG
ncbi:MAG: hypothetical protein PHR16_04615 [Methylovulum sp.]|nr:hypothetical protein [Methylovulum sp.]